ncbi:MAG: adaptor protein MecA [Clostridiales bacterium]|nr:adaptor protein MecA [Clostridiales bacterium]
MKIEKISENQIRCTLNYSDLRARQLSLLELAYGGDKARGLFREMIEKAGNELDFHVDDIPLMIEAIPLSSEGIMLIITKIEDPDELDTRFAKFAPGIEDTENESEPAPEPVFTGSAGDILDALNQILENTESKETSVPDIHISSIFCFQKLDPLISAARVLHGIYQGKNSLYKSDHDHQYYLVAHKSNHTPEEFNKICNVLTEYGERIRSNPATEAYYQEHFELLTADQALQNLAR